MEVDPAGVNRNLHEASLRHLPTLPYPSVSMAESNPGHVSLTPANPVIYAPSQAEEVAIPPTPEKQRLAEEVAFLQQRVGYIEHEARSVLRQEKQGWESAAQGFEKEARDILKVEISQQTLRLTDQANNRVVQHEN